MARTGLNDGLGQEEVMAGSDASLQTQHIFVTGSLTAGNQISGANIYSNGAVATSTLLASSTGSFVGTVRLGSSMVSTFAQGYIINGPTAESIISGGMWITGSAASGATPAVVSIAGPASTGQPLGICLATCASGAVPTILKSGYYRGLVAEASINNGVGFSVGAGTALNCIKAAAAGTTRGTVIMGAGSEGTTAVWLL